MQSQDIELWEYTRRHPDSTHCVTMLDAMTTWNQITHDTCPCVCHSSYTSMARADKKARKRGKKRV